MQPALTVAATEKVKNAKNNKISTFHINH